MQIVLQNISKLNMLFLEFSFDIIIKNVHDLKKEHVQI